MAGGAALAAATTACAIATICAARMLGGRTGDTLGATISLAEVAVWVTLLGFSRLKGG